MIKHLSFLAGFLAVLFYVHARSFADGALPAPPKMCTKIGCMSRLNLEIAHNKLWPKGAYIFELRVNDEEARCESFLPFPSSCEVVTKCTGDLAVVIGESGCALDEAAQGFSMINVMPSQFQALEGDKSKALILSARILFEGREMATIAEQSIMPQCFRPNGEGCAPYCCQAGASFIWQ